MNWRDKFIFHFGHSPGKSILSLTFSFNEHRPSSVKFAISHFIFQ